MFSDHHRTTTEAANVEARAGLVRRYRDPLIRYFSRRGVSGSAVEDMAHDCFTRLFALTGHHQIENEEAYIFQTASSVLADSARRARRHQVVRHVCLDDAFFDCVPSDAPGPDRVLDGKEAFSRFQAAFKELKPKTREIFLLNRLEGLTYTQIAVRYRLTQSAIEKHMIGALAHLRKRLKDRRR
jgi:RNA polymerase sigma factor (sigma-70 family)